MNEISPIITLACINKESTTTIDTDNTIHTNSEPLLLSPASILRGNELVVDTLSHDERRPSLVKFSVDSKSHEGDISDKRCVYSNKKRRPSYLSNVSSVKTATISIHDNTDPNTKQGIVLCCRINKKSKRQYPIKWEEFYATMSPSNSLQLYPICHCNINQQNFFHVAFHKYNTYYKKPRYQLQLDTCKYHLSLTSPIDFVWSLESNHCLYYFQTSSIKESQAWYQAMYKVLPSQAKKPVPPYIDVHLPQLRLSVRLPLTDLVKGNETVDLRRVRDGALALLRRQTDTHWHTRAVSVCWRYNDVIDWVVEPDSTQPINLIEPRLIENIHVLELWHERLQEFKSFIKPKEALLIGSNHKPYHASLIEHYLFLYEMPQQTKRHCFEGLWRHAVVPQGQIGHLYQVIDLFKVKSLTEDRLIVDPSTMQYSHTFSIYQYMQTYKKNQQIKEVGIMYVKSKHRFEKRLCILTNTGDFYSLVPHGHQHPLYSLDFFVSLANRVLYILSGEALCDHLPDLPMEQLPSMYFDNDMITQDTRPNQCCFIMYFQQRTYLFLTRHKQENERWLKSMCYFLQQ